MFVGTPATVRITRHCNVKLLTPRASCGADSGLNCVEALGTLVSNSRLIVLACVFMKPNSEAKPLPPPSSKNGAAEARLNSEAVAVDLIERAANVEIQGHEAAFYYPF